MTSYEPVSTSWKTNAIARGCWDSTRRPLKRHRSRNAFRVHNEPFRHLDDDPEVLKAIERNLHHRRAAPLASTTGYGPNAPGEAYAYMVGAKRLRFSRDPTAPGSEWNKSGYQRRTVPTSTCTKFESR